MYNWSEAKVGVTQERECFYQRSQDESQGMAVRKCASHDSWTSPIKGSELSYDGSMCTTQNSFELYQLFLTFEVQE